MERRLDLDRRGEPVAKPPYSLRRWEEQVIDHYGGKGNIGAVLLSSPVNEFSFSDGKGHPQVGTLSLDAEMVLKSTDIRPYRV